MAGFHVRATLGFHELAQYGDDAEIITSELVTNAIQHVCGDGIETVGLILARTWNPEAVTVVVSDSSPEGPGARETSADKEQGRGLQIVEALSAHWGLGGGVAASTASRRAVGHRRREHPYPAPAQGVESGEARRADGLAKCLYRMRRRRPSRRPAAGFHRDGNRAPRGLFGVSARQLTTRRANCGGHPPAGFACLACGAAPGNDRLPHRLTSGTGAVRPRGTVRVTGRRATWRA